MPTKEIHVTVARRRSEEKTPGLTKFRGFSKMLFEICRRRTARIECCTRPRAFAPMNVARDDCFAGDLYRTKNVMQTRNLIGVVILLLSLSISTPARASNPNNYNGSRNV